MSLLTTALCASLQLALLQEEWKSRSLASQLTTGAELAESSTTDGFQHPRIRLEKPAAYSPNQLSSAKLLWRLRGARVTVFDDLRDRFSLF